MRVPVRRRRSRRAMTARAACPWCARPRDRRPSTSALRARGRSRPSRRHRAGRPPRRGRTLTALISAPAPNASTAPTSLSGHGRAMPRSAPMTSDDALSAPQPRAAVNRPRPPAGSSPRRRRATGVSRPSRKRMSSPREVDVDEAAQPAVVVGDPLAQLAVLGVERLEHLADRARRSTCASAAPPAASRSCVGSLTVTAIRRRRRRTPRRTRRPTARSRSTSNVPRTASSVFRPSPVM